MESKPAMPELTSMLPALTVAALILGVSSLLWNLLLWRRIGRSGGRAVRRRGPPGSVEDQLRIEAERVDGLVRQHEIDASRLDGLDRRGRKALQRVGLVRYNPFEDTGSNQSFALVLLDEDGDGVVLSSLHSRQTTRVYVKPVSGGRSEGALSAEETEAFRIASVREQRRPGP
jgi:hypothetical protein